MRERSTMHARLHTSARALVQEVLPSGALRIVIEDETTSRTVWLDNVSIPPSRSPNSEEAMAGANSVRALSHLLQHKLILVHFTRYDADTDNLFVRAFMLRATATQVSGTHKLVDTVDTTNASDAKYKFPEDLAPLTVDRNLVNMNLFVTKIRGCFIVLGNEPRDWFARKSDWRRLSQL